MTNDTILAVEHLSRGYGTPEMPVISDLSFSISRRGRVTVFAPTGAGKSTLINILSGVDRDYKGRFALASDSISTVFQEPRLFPYMTVEENVFLPLRMRGQRVSDAIRDEYERWLEVCDLASNTHRYPYQLSGGMKQKVALIRGLITDPEFVMLDEPFKSLDLRAKQAISRHIREAYPRISLLFVTHVLEEAPLLTDSLLLFRTNRLGEYTLHPTSRLDAILTEDIYGQSQP